MQGILKLAPPALGTCKNKLQTLKKTKQNTAFPLLVSSSGPSIPPLTENTSGKMHRHLSHPKLWKLPPVTASGRLCNSSASLIWNVTYFHNPTWFSDKITNVTSLLGAQQSQSLACVSTECSIFFYVVVVIFLSGKALWVRCPMDTSLDLQSKNKALNIKVKPFKLIL